jgi:RNA polymerase sigma factor (sigma-70 family)
MAEGRQRSTPVTSRSPLPDAPFRDPSSASNEVLIAAALGHGQLGRRAWEELVRRHSRAVWKALWSFSLSSTDRDDLFQSTWTRALERLGQVREPDRVHVWLMAIARNEATSHQKKAARLLPTEDVDPGSQSPVDADELMQDERRQVFATAFQRLGAEGQNLLRLLTVDPPMSYKEIETLMGWKDGGTSIRRARCLEKLRATPEVQGYLTSLTDQDGGDRTP